MTSKADYLKRYVSGGGGDHQRPIRPIRANSASAVHTQAEVARHWELLERPPSRQRPPPEALHLFERGGVGGGASAWVAKTVRRTPKSCFDPRIKNYQWGDMTAGLLEAKERGFDTTILLDHDGCVTEGPGFNVFSVQAGGRLVTAESGMLEGISRRTVLEICRAEGYTVEERPLPLDELMRSEEVFITSTAGGVMPLTRVDDLVFGGGAPGEVARRLRERYWEMVRKPELRTEIEFAA